jgi:hypothetical protein
VPVLAGHDQDGNLRRPGRGLLGDNQSSGGADQRCDNSECSFHRLTSLILILPQ